MVMSNYKFNMHDRIRIRDEEDTGTVLGKYTFTVYKDSNHDVVKETGKRYVVWNDNKKMKLTYGEECLVQYDDPPEPKTRKILLW